MNGGHLDLPAFLPDGVHFLYLDHTAGDRSGIHVASIDAGPDQQPTSPILAADGGPVLVDDADWSYPRILFLRQGELLAQEFDAAALAPVGDPVTVAAGVATAGNAWYSASANGDVLLYRAGAEFERTPVWVNRDGAEEIVNLPSGAYAYPRVSPDGRRLAVASFDGDVYTWDFAREVRANVTASEAEDAYVAWTPDGQRLIFLSGAPGQRALYWQAADGSGEAERLTEPGDGEQQPYAVSPDGKWVVYRTRGRGFDVRMASLMGDHAPQDLVSTEFNDLGREGARWGIEIARSAHEMGIPIATGTDNAAAGAHALFEELELLVDAVGLTPTEGLSAATHAGARVLGLQDEFGSVETGKIADLVLYQEDPTTDIRNARQPSFVIRNGTIVRR